MLNVAPTDFTTDYFWRCKAFCAYKHFYFLGFQQGGSSHSDRGTRFALNTSFARSYPGSSRPSAARPRTGGWSSKPICWCARISPCTFTPTGGAILRFGWIVSRFQKAPVHGSAAVCGYARAFKHLGFKSFHELDIQARRPSTSWTGKAKFAYG